MNLDLGGVTIGWREAVLGLIVLVAAYMGFVLLRMRRLRRPVAAAPAEPAAPPPVDEPPPLPSVPEPSAAAWEEPPAQLARPEAAAAVGDEVAQLRDEVDALRGELAALRDELHAEIAHMRAAQTVSPIYSDAMQMATAGHDAVTIAQHCGISRAEAELVVALVTSQQN